MITGIHLSGQCRRLARCGPVDRAGPPAPCRLPVSPVISTVLLGLGDQARARLNHFLPSRGFPADDAVGGRNCSSRSLNQIAILRCGGAGCSKRRARTTTSSSSISNGFLQVVERPPVFIASSAPLDRGVRRHHQNSCRAASPSGRRGDGTRGMSSRPAQRFRHDVCRRSARRR